MLHDAFEIALPEARTTSVVFASPHSGRLYPAAFLERASLDECEIRSSEDAFVDELYASAPRAGAPLIAARYPRAYIDLNRSADELDPALIEGIGRRGHNPRIASGLGVVPRVVAGGRMIYRGKITRAEARDRIDTIWRPYHERLRQLLDESHAAFGEAILVDCHSMPHEALEALGGAATGPGRPEVVLGDRYGAAAHPDLVDRIEQIFTAAGLKVARNMPFAGAYVVQTYGRPARGRHAVQIELDRALYMDETRIAPNANYPAMQALMDRVVAEIAAIGRRTDLSVAAE